MKKSSPQRPEMVILTESRWNDLSDAATFPSWHLANETSDQYRIRVWSRKVTDDPEMDGVCATNDCQIDELDPLLLWSPSHGWRVVSNLLSLPRKRDSSIPREMLDACSRARVILLFLKGGTDLLDTIVRTWPEKVLIHPTDNFMISYSRRREWKYFLKSGLELAHYSLLKPRGIVFVSDADARYFRKWFPWSRTQAVAIPLGVDTEKFFPNPDKPGTEIRRFRFGFTGDLGYHPNEEACRYLVDRIVPMLPQDVEVVFGGRRPSSFIQEAAARDKRIVVTGRVEDIAVLYRSFDVFIAPIFHGAGMQNKLLEASASGLPCITTSVCAAAFSQIPPNFVIADDPPAITRSALELFETPCRRAVLGAAGRAHILNQYSWRARAEAILQFFP